MKGIPTTCKFYDETENRCSIGQDDEEVLGCDNDSFIYGCQVFEAIEYAYIQGFTSGKRFEQEKERVLEDYGEDIIYK